MRFAGALCVALLAPGSPEAQSPESPEACGALLETLSAQALVGMVLEAPDFRLEDGACVANDLLGLWERNRLTLEELRFRYDGPLDLETPRYARAVEVEITGLRAAPQTGSMADLDYAFAAQARAREGIDARLSAGFEAGRLVLDQLRIDFPGENAIEARLELTGLSDDPLQALDGRVARMELSIQSNGLFEQYALLPLATMLLSGQDDPEAEVVRLKDEGRAALASLPLTEETVAALEALIDDMPNPTGMLSLILAPEGGVAVRDVITPFGPGEGFLTGLEARYEPAE